MKQQRYTVMILYGHLYPKWELNPIRCIKCSRMIGKVKGDVYWITNSAGIPLESIDPSMSYIELQCHSCKALFKLLMRP